MTQYPAQPPPGAPMQPNNHPQGTTILVLGILGLVVCSPLGIVAWVMGNKAQREAEAMNAANLGMIKAGRICGIVATCLLILTAVLLVGLFAAGGS